MTRRRLALPMYRCEKHNLLLIGNHDCEFCVEERKTGKPLGPLGGERLTYTDGTSAEGQYRLEGSK